MRRPQGGEGGLCFRLPYYFLIYHTFHDSLGAVNTTPPTGLMTSDLDIDSCQQVFRSPTSVRAAKERLLVG